MDAVLDFARSYVLWTRRYNANDRLTPGQQPWGNAARILFDAHCTLTDTRTGQREVFFLSTPCQAEWMYRDEQIFVRPSADYRAIHSATRYRPIGRRLTEDDPADNLALGRPSDLVAAFWVGYELVARPLPRVTPLPTEAAIIAAVRAGESLVGRTELWDATAQVRATLEYPIKTINFHAEYGRVQVDTGPLLVPDFAATDEHWIDRLALAHIGYNTFDRAEFIIRCPTPIKRAGRTVANVLHYSEVRVLAAWHTVFTAG